MCKVMCTHKLQGFFSKQNTIEATRMDNLRGNRKENLHENLAQATRLADRLRRCLT